MKLSIITINRNNAHGLRETIESVVSQTFTDFEYIVIDGVSTDSSVEVIKEYFNQIDYWVSEPDSGIYNAMNKGIHQASGEYCLFLNSGDYLYNENTLKLLFANEFNQDIVYCDRKSVIEFNEVDETIFPDKLTFEKFFNSTIGHQSTLIKRELFEIIGNYNENNRYASDWEFFMLALAKYNCSYKHISLFLSYYDITGISCQQENLQEMHDERKAILIKHFPFFYDDYILLNKEKQFHNLVRNRKFIRRIKDIVLYLMKSSNFDR